MKILFQGNSITDAQRSRDADFLSGSGYPTIAGGAVVAECPSEISFVNRAVSGNRVVDLYARWRIDAINLMPDVISILIGINDVWHELGGRKNGVEADRFEKVYAELLAYTKNMLPDVKLMLLEPFVLRADATEADWDFFAAEVPLRAEATRRVAEQYGAAFVPLQKAFDEAAKKAPASVFLKDGVHPTPAGHTLIAQRWLEAFRSEIL
ncbi:MAG: SGNH/GDSL hydrolase family protein [Christensenellales bacterium]|jgi:lysophospholipase L1-like esterase